VAEFRFYEELNDFLAPPRRKRTFTWSCPQDATVKHAIEALGVPHTEVDLILVNGESVGFSRLVQRNDRISVYPQFESFDITPLVRLRSRPLRNVRFITDAHLGGLAKYLRMLGFDTLTRDDRTAGEVIRVATSERRILLTRSRSLLMHRTVTHGFFVHEQRPLLQCEEVVSRLQLRARCRPFSRCLRCNVRLEELDRQAAASRLDPPTLKHFEEFRYCSSCHRVYWEGSHYRRMAELVERLSRQHRAPDPG
jgi:uncharacterized protein with PIN domain